MNEVVKLEDLTVQLGGFKLDSVSLSVSQGDYFVLIGPTGSGKTSLLKTIVGAYRQRSGTIAIDGSDVTREPPERRRVAYVPQGYTLFDHMDVRSNIEFGLRAKGVTGSKREELLKKVANSLQLENLLSRTPATLSGGEQQKVALARALATEPSVLLLDEPLSMMDPETRQSIARSLRSISEGYKVPVIHVAHDRDEAYALATRMAIMMRGRILESGSPEEIFDRPSNPDTASFTGFQNVLPGKAVANDHGSMVNLDGLQLRSRAGTTGEVHVCIRPEWVKVGVESGENLFTGKVLDRFKERFGYRSVVRIGRVELTIFTGEDVTVGQELTLQIPGDRVHLIPVGR